MWLFCKDVKIKILVSPSLSLLIKTWASSGQKEAPIPIRRLLCDKIIKWVALHSAKSKRMSLEFICSYWLLFNKKLIAFFSFVSFRSIYVLLMTSRGITNPSGVVMDWVPPRATGRWSSVVYLIIEWLWMTSAHEIDYGVARSRRVEAGLLTA